MRPAWTRAETQLLSSTCDRQGWPTTSIVVWARPPPNHVCQAVWPGATAACHANLRLENVDSWVCAPPRVSSWCAAGVSVSTP